MLKEKISVNYFLSKIKNYKDEQIECTEHTFFRLSESQRKMYTYNELRRILLKELPFLVGLQFNGNYAIFYKYKNKVLKIIASLNKHKINVVTFYFIKEWQIPKI